MGTEWIDIKARGPVDGVDVLVKLRNGGYCVRQRSPEGAWRGGHECSVGHVTFTTEIVYWAEITEAPAPLEASNGCIHCVHRIYGSTSHMRCSLYRRSVSATDTCIEFQRDEGFSNGN